MDIVEAFVLDGKPKFKAPSGLNSFKSKYHRLMSSLFVMALQTVAIGALKVRSTTSGSGLLRQQFGEPLQALRHARFKSADVFVRLRRSSSSRANEREFCFAIPLR